MARLAFLPPVPVRTSEVICDINSVREALVFLNQWPRARRDLVYAGAVRSCNCAIAGQMPPEEARQAFVSFARMAGVLAQSDRSASAGADGKKSVAPRDS
ncbi:DUF982 domain-containing protein [Mesorhizobium japonicum]|uniref:DUF982 domain-containing protein n=1 Tax=Mesorhizobium japonicum TaxID=2066070 RepID=UPI0009B5AA5B|nr:DUF982 domain-containing protein [Mesorhizobium japonicum]